MQRGILNVSLEEMISNGASRGEMMLNEESPLTQAGIIGRLRTMINI
jgi:hypothetical protein